MKRFLVVLLVMATLLGVAPEVSQAGPPFCAAIPAEGSPGRILILIQGISSSASSVYDMAEEWEVITRELKDVYFAFVYFSYDRDDYNSYSASDTYYSIENHHVPLLRDLVRSCLGIYGHESIDLIGHSMGGLVAFQYVVTDGVYEDGVIQNVITIDSPVNGSFWASVRELSALVPGIPSGMVNSQAAAEMGEFHENYDFFARNNRDVADELSDYYDVEVVTITNADDLFVPVRDGVIVGHEYVFHLGRSGPGWSAKIGHNQALHSLDVARQIRSIVR